MQFVARNITKVELNSTVTVVYNVVRSWPLAYGLRAFDGALNLFISGSLKINNNYFSLHAIMPS